MARRRRLLILDRDGVINRDSDAYIKSPDEWQPLPGSLDAIARLNRAGFEIAVATNQSGVARGFFDEATLAAIHDKMSAAVEEAGGHVALIRFCPHGPDEGCDCRKPKPGLLHEIAAHFRADLTRTIFVGDSLKDLETAAAVGAMPILVRTGNGARTEASLPERFRHVRVYDDLAAAADALTARAA